MGRTLACRGYPRTRTSPVPGLGSADLGLEPLDFEAEPLDGLLELGVLPRQSLDRGRGVAGPGVFRRPVAWTLGQSRIVRDGDRAVLESRSVAFGQDHRAERLLA